jgi:type II secretion system protein I
MKCSIKSIKECRDAARVRRAVAGGATGFTLIEVLISLALIAVLIPVVMEALKTATLAGEVSERKAIAARVADHVLNDAIIAGTTLTATAGSETVGPYNFRWTMKDEPWTALNGITVLSNPNSVNGSVVNSTLIHQVSVKVSYTAQGRDFSVSLATLINTQPLQ